jgi:hypothetical protein
MTRRGGPLTCWAIALFALAPQCLQPAAAGPASSFGPEVQVGEARGGYVGTMHVASFHGEVGTPFTVTAEGLPVNEEFQLVWRTVNGRWKVTDSEYHGREYVTVAYEMAKVRTDAAGRVQATFETPEDFGFVHDVVLQQGTRLLTQAGYSIDMAIDISPRSGPVGTPITVAVTGIGWRNLHSSWDLLYDNNYTGWISAVTTHGTATFSIPATGHVGDHIIEVLHGQFTFPYRNMQQSPEPDRPRWAIPFTITPGEPVLPPAADEQAQTHVRLSAPRGELMSTPRFSGVDEPITVRGEGLKPGEHYTLNWTRVIGNRMTGLGWEESSTPSPKRQRTHTAASNSASRHPTISAARMVCGSTQAASRSWGLISSRRRRSPWTSRADRSAPRSRCISRAWAGLRPPTSCTWSTTTALLAMPALSTARAMSRYSCRRPARRVGTSSISIPASTRAWRPT